MHTERPDPSVAAQLKQALCMLVEIHVDVRKLRHDLNKDKDQLMSAIDDLKTAVPALVTEAVTDLEAVLGKIGTTPPDNTADLVALTQQANDAVAKLKADMAPLTTPAPAPAPTPASAAAASTDQPQV